MQRQAAAEPLEGWIRENFERQDFMKTIGAEIAVAAGGCAEVRVPVRAGLLQQHGHVHAGVISAIADAAARYAALSLWGPDTEVATAEFKVNLLSPARGDVLVARSRVVRSGKRLAVYASDVFSVAGGDEKRVATLLATIEHRGARSA